MKMAWKMKMGRVVEMLLIGCLLIGLIRTESSEKDFSFAGDKDSYQDDEDFLPMDEAGSGSGVEEVPTGIPVLYRATINITSVVYSAEIAAAGRNLDRLAITQQIQDAIQKVLDSIQGTVRIRIVEFNPGSLMVTFDIDTDGQQTEEEIVQLLKDTLNSGNLNGFTVSPTGFDFKKIRESEGLTCAETVGRVPSDLPTESNNWANLMIGNTFPCNGYVTEWTYYRKIPFGYGYAGVFRQISETEFVLIGKTRLPDAPVGAVTVIVDTPILVQRGDFIGVFYEERYPDGVVAKATEKDVNSGVIEDSDLYQNFLVSFRDSDIAVNEPFSLSEYPGSSEIRVTHAIEATMSYANIPSVTDTRVTAACTDSQWACKNGDCIDAAYHCDQQVDCYDGSDEDNCPEPPCPSDEFQCANKELCLPQQFVCNFVNDCSDKSDEVDCPPAPVRIDSFRDGSDPNTFLLSWTPPQDGGLAILGYVIRYRKIQVRSERTADGDYIIERPLSAYSQLDVAADTTRYSLDGLEAGGYYEVEVTARNSGGLSEPRPFILGTASVGCRPGEWQCITGGCITVEQRCDTFPDCDDGSDEDGELCVSSTCNEGMQKCPQPDGSFICVLESVGCAVQCAANEFLCLDETRCIDFRRLCDGVNDCADLSDEANCECADGEFQCVSDRRCINDRYRCDSRRDCNDGSDEDNCPCLAGNFQCTNTPSQECVDIRLKCDGYSDCSDGSDEVGCGCPDGQWQCADGNCIPDSLRCDGRAQCEDLSDEVECGCRDDQFTCDDRNCIDLDMKCDQVKQCEDGSDEIDCPCPDGMFQCADGNCIEGSMKCDGVEQCEDRSDEVGCPPPNCPTGDFQCLASAKPGRLDCIDGRLRCDGYEDCTDGSDERDCPGCRGNEFECESDGQCLPASSRCNAAIECSDRSDELNCACNETQFRCGDGICIDGRRRCDRRYDCDDQSDEIACPCRSGQFQCVNGDCIEATARCDGQPDCADRSDEAGCPGPRRCPDGYYQCKSGHCLSENRHCDQYADCPDGDDEDECPLQCDSEELKCEIDNKCLKPEELCNRVYDCSDGHDERDTCTPCREDEFLCVSDRSCISRAGYCNNIKECADGSDEMGCPPTLPPISVVVSPKNLRIRMGVAAVLSCFATGLPQDGRVTWSRANLGLPMQSSVENGKLMIPVAKVMDSGDYVCSVEGVPGNIQDVARLEVVAIGPTEEPDTSGPCSREEAVCQNGQCIRREYRCDGEADCTDGSDEPDDCYTNLCEPNEFRCPNGQCVMKIWRCDGENDCSDGFDEQNCRERLPTDPCNTDEYQCVSGDQCVPFAYQCDQEIDCLDRSDEIGCSPPIITIPPVDNIEVELGGAFTIICEAVGVPTPLIVWRLNWGNLFAGPDRATVVNEDGRGSLTIVDAQYEDAGAYTCEAINNRGSIFAIPDALVIVRREGVTVTSANRGQKGPCNPPFFNFGALSTEECVRCFCFGQSVQCFSSDLHVSKIALANQMQLSRRDDKYFTTVEPGAVNFKTSTREFQVLDMQRSLPAGSYYWSLPHEFLGDRLTSYGGELKYTIFYDIEGRTRETTDPDVIISGNDVTLYYRGRTLPSPGVPTSISVPLIESAWEKTDGPRRGDTLISDYASREDLMMVLENVEHIEIRAAYDDRQTTSRIGGVFMTTAVDYATDFGRAVLVEECTCPTGYTGRSCQDCASGFTHVTQGEYLGQCVTCNCYGHSNDCDRVTGQCLNCRHNTFGPQCQVCADLYYGDPRRGTPEDCKPCPCPLTESPNQFSRTCYLDTDNDVTCAACPTGYEGRRCERCAEGYVGDPMTPGSSCRKTRVDDYCDPRGSMSPLPNPLTRRCKCKENVVGDRCDRCRENSFYLSDRYNLGCVRCFCMGVSRICQSTSSNRAQVGVSFSGEDSGFTITDMAGKPLDDQRLSIVSNRELVYRSNNRESDTYYWSLPSRFLGDKVTSYGGALRFNVRYSSRQGGAIDSREPLVKISGNDITLVHRTRTEVPANSPTAFSVTMFEQNWLRIDGQPATREHLLMALADLDSILIRAAFEEDQTEAGIQDVTLDVAENRQTRQDRAYAVEQCVCPVGYKGLSCEDCDTGYSRSGGGLYLGLCEPCRCNGHSSECDPENGVCRNCQHNTAGDYCDECAVSYYGDATRGSRSDCQKCPCPLTEAPNQFSPSCILDTDGQVTCTACPGGHTGRRCESCIAGYTGNPNRMGDYCKLGPVDTCDCDARGTVPNTQCDTQSQQCQCKPYTQGRRCARCREGHFYLESNNPQGCLTCFCSGITNQCTSSSYYRETMRPQLNTDDSHNFVLMNRRMNNIVTDGFYVNQGRNQITFNQFEAVQRERESLFFQLPAKFRGDRVTSYGGYLRFTLEYTADQAQGRPYRDVDFEVISAGQSLRLYYLFEPSLEEGKSQTYEILLREDSFSDLRSNTAPTRETFMSILSNIEGILIRATYDQKMTSVTLRDVSMDNAVPAVTDLGGAPMVEDCRCPEGYQGLSCQRCAQGYLRVSDGRGGLDRCVRCNCNAHGTTCDPDTGRCLECQHNTEGDRCERCIAGYYGDATSGTSTDCRPCACPLTIPTNQFSRTCNLAEDNKVTCDRCPTGYTGRQCETCAAGYIGDPRQPGETCRPRDEDLRPDVAVAPRRVEEPTGSIATFQCSVTGQGPFNVVWSRIDRRQLPARAFVSPQYDLSIRDLRKDDSGRYVCTATNAYGVTRAEVELRVVVGPPPLMVQIDNTRIEIEEGRTARFVCTAVSTSRDSFYILAWKKQGSVMPAKAIDQNGVLVIPDVRRSDSGNYVCTGSDMVMMDEETAVLLVVEGPEPAPTVRIEPRYQTVEEGNTVRFSCIANGIPQPKIEWYRGGNRPLNPQATVTTDGVFTIPRASPSDEADYYCKATNEAGTTEVRTILYVTKVERPPIDIVVREVTVVAIVGETAYLECHVEDATGRITVFWSSPNGLPSRSSQEEGLLTIPNVQPSYGGNYICTGTDHDTGDTNTAVTVLEVNVVSETEVPKVSVEPEKITIPMGTTGTLRCTATGSPPPTVTWTKSRAELGTNHQVSGNVLRITHAMMEDRGIYVCRAENVAGMDQDWAVVEVERRMRPKIDVYPNTTQRIPVGSSALFQCRVMDGDPPPTITWTRAGNLVMTEKIEIMDNGVIMFKQATQAEQGSYMCTATNDIGVVSATVTLIVEGPPTITLQPSQVIYALIGQRVTLECTAEGEPTPVVYWIEPRQPRRGDLPPDGVEASYPTSDGSSVLDIRSISREDQGYYTCVASNSGGRTEDSVQVIVQEEESSAGVSIAGPSTLPVSEGQNVELDCSANAIVNPVIRWRRREGNLPPGHSVSDGLLRIPRFRSQYAGEYICSTQAPQGNFEVSVFLIVTVLPRLTVSPQRITTRAGDAINLRCAASGSGPFNIEWSKVNGQMNPRANERDGVLEIAQVTAADAGRYRCTVQSNIGTSDAYATVEVEVPPAVAVREREAIAERGNTVELRCEVTGSPAPIIRWERDQTELPAQHRIRDGVLTIYNVQPEDEGRYICTASSSAGQARDFTMLRVRSGPVIDNKGGDTIDTQIVNVGDRVSLECIVTGTPPPTVTWSRDDGPIPADTIIGDGILIIPQAAIEDGGTYTCLAVNPAGSITSKVVLYVRARPEIHAPQRVTSAALGERVSLECDASGYPTPDITWFRKNGDMPNDYTIVDGDLTISRVRPEDAGTYVCTAQNEYGRTDIPVDLSVGDLVPYFTQNPTSYISYDALKDVYLDFDILLSLKPESTEGMILYNGQFDDGGGDFVCFGLNEGYPEFRFDVGSGPAVIRGNNTMDLNKWHTVKLTRNKKKGSMVVDDEPAYSGQSPGFFTGLDLAENMYLGSVPDYNKIPKVTGIKEGFVGTISEVKLKGVSLDLGADAREVVGVRQHNACRDRPCRNSGTCYPANKKYGYKCVCAQGYAGDMCELTGESCYPGACGPEGRCYNLEGYAGFRCVCPLGKTGPGCQLDISIINPFFNRTSFSSYTPADDGLFSLVIYLEYKPQSLSDGIILYHGNNRDGSGDFLAILQKDGYVEFRFDTGSGHAVVRSRSPIRVNEWTRVTASRKNRDGTLIVNDDEPVTERAWAIQGDQGYKDAHPRFYNYYDYKFKRYKRGASGGYTVGLNLQLHMYLGGPDPSHVLSSNAGTTQGLIGCVAELQVNDRRVDLVNDALESLNVVDCGERRLCDRQPCDNKGICEDLPGPDYKCLCPSTHQGKNCDVEINICLTNSPCLNNAACSITDDGYRCDCPLGYDGSNCEYEIGLDTSIGVVGDGFVEFSKDLLPHANTQERQTISFTIRTTQRDGLIFWQGEQSGRPLRGGDHFSIGLKGGYIDFSYEMGSGPAVIMSRSRIDDGQRHRVTVSRLGRSGSLTVDADDTVTGESQGFLQMLNADGNIYIGGVSIIDSMTDGKYSSNFIGCIEDITIQSKGPLRVREDAVSGYNVKACAP